MLNIQPQYLSLSDLLKGRLFRIPEYQRAYSWTSRERKDLFGDIEKLHNQSEDEAHFMATVVLLRRHRQPIGTDVFYTMEVVDGQQRLTTLIILLKVIEQKLIPTDRLALELKELLVKPESEALLLLQTNHDSSHHFENYLREATAVNSHTAITLADREILRAIEDCQEFVEGWLGMNNDIQSLAALLKNRLFFLLHEIEDERSVYTVFEVLNSRGMEVSWLDRMKSILMGTVYEIENINTQELINDLHTIWRDIYQVIGLHQGLSTESLRFTATLYSEQSQSRPLSEKDAVETLRQIARNATSIRRVANFLLEVTKVCDEITTNTRIKAVTKHSQARLLAVAIQLRKDIRGKREKQLLELWEKVTFRIYGMLRNDARTGVGEYVRLAWKVWNEKLSVDEISEQILIIGERFPVEDAVDALKKVNCYGGWEVELRYLMYRYEEFLCKQERSRIAKVTWEKIWRSTPSDSIEHIKAQSAINEENKHRLGNLMLLEPELNSALQDKKPSEKVESYRRTGLRIAREVADMIDAKNNWTKKTIVERENKILEWAKIEWGD